MSTDLRTKLRRLGVHKGAAKIQASPNPRLPGRAGGEIESLVDGRLVETPYGPAFLHEETYAVDHLHGGHALGDLLNFPPGVVAQIANEPALAQVDLSRVIFLDTETTGLSGGTGTLVFLIGVGAFDVPPSSPARDAQRHDFVLRQYFLRTPSEEPAMLHALAEWLDGYDAVVSFNGRGFDMPLLESRFTLARMRPRILRAPHLDLLMPARRVWRGRLESCRLSALEQHILNVQREQADVPGFLIPEMYMNYIRFGDASEMPRVLYHNKLDVLSMVSLSTRLITLFSTPFTSPPPAGGINGALDAGDWLALGKWYGDLDRVTDAEAALRACLAASPDALTEMSALHRLGHLLKRLGRRQDAVRAWQALSAYRTWEGAEACIELAKHCEWREVDLAQAAAWTGQATDIVAGLPEGYARDRLAAELAHRISRLNRKAQVVC